MKRLQGLVLGVVALVAIGLALAPAGGARASEWWCWSDPVVLIDGQVVQVRVGVPRALQYQVAWADIAITVPAGVDAQVVAVPSPAFPQQVTLLTGGNLGPDGAIPVSVQVIVHARQASPVALDVRSPAGSGVMVMGTDATPLTVSLSLTRFGRTNALRQDSATR